MDKNQLSSVAAASAAAGFIVSGAAVVGHPVPDEHWGTRGAVVDGFAALGFLLVACVIPRVGSALHAGPAGRVASRAAALGYLIMGAESVASLLHGGNTWGPSFFVGLLLALVSSIVLSVSAVRARHHTWLSTLPALALLIGVAAGNQGGFMLLGLGWLALGTSMLPRRAPGAALA